MKYYIIHVSTSLQMKTLLLLALILLSTVNANSALLTEEQVEQFGEALHQVVSSDDISRKRFNSKTDVQLIEGLKRNIRDFQIPMEKTLAYLKDLTALDTNRIIFKICDEEISYWSFTRSSQKSACARGLSFALSPKAWGSLYTRCNYGRDVRVVGDGNHLISEEKLSQECFEGATMGYRILQLIMIEDRANVGAG